MSRRFRGDQQCPKHKYRPGFFDSIPIAGVRELKPASDGGNGASVDAIEQANQGQLNAIRSVLYNDSDNE